MSQITLSIRKSSFLIGNTVLSRLVHIIFIGSSIFLPSFLLISLVNLNYSLAVSFLIFYVAITLAFLGYNYIFLDLIPKEPPGFISLLQLSFVITLTGLLNIPPNNLLPGRLHSSSVFFGTFFVLLIFTYLGYWAFATKKRILATSLIFLFFVELLSVSFIILKLIGHPLDQSTPAILIFVCLVCFVVFHKLSSTNRILARNILTINVFLLTIFFNNLFTASMAALFVIFSILTNLIQIPKKYNVTINKNVLKFTKSKFTILGLVYSAALMFINIFLVINCLPLLVEMIRLVFFESISKEILNISTLNDLLIGKGVSEVTSSIPFIFNLFRVGGIVTIISFLLYIFRPFVIFQDKTRKIIKENLIILLLLLTASTIVILDRFVLLITIFFVLFILLFFSNQNFVATTNLNSTNFLLNLSKKFIANEYRAKKASFLILTIMIFAAFIFFGKYIFLIKIV